MSARGNSFNLWPRKVKRPKIREKREQLRFACSLLCVTVKTRWRFACQCSWKRRNDFVGSLCTLCGTRSTSITAHTANRQLRVAPVSVAKPGKISLIKCMSYHSIRTHANETNKFAAYCCTFPVHTWDSTNHQLFISAAGANDENLNLK